MRGPLRSLQRFFFKREIRRLRREMGDRIHRDADGRVQAGPLAGMSVVRDEAWGDDMAAKILGTYERELREPVRRLVRERSYGRAVVVGCAEGYWAVGLALLLPEAGVVAFEEDRRARKVAAANARANGVADRLELRGRCGREELRAALDEGRTRKGSGASVADAGASAPVEDAPAPVEDAPAPVLCLVDVEGEEVELLDPEAVPGLRSADLVVECHDRRDGSIRPRLMERFRGTHRIEVVERQGRSPSKLDALRHYPDIEAYLAILEMRSRSSGWLVMRPEGAGG